MTSISLGLLLELLAFFMVGSAEGEDENQKSSYRNPYTYRCVHQKCDKILVGSGEYIQDLNGCKMTCSEFGMLWPLPTGKVYLSTTLINFLPGQLHLAFEPEEPSQRLSTMTEELGKVFANYLHSTHPSYDSVTKANPYPQFQGVNSVVVKVKIDSGDTRLMLDTDESYSIQVKAQSAKEILVEIKAKTYFGARHGLETLSQMIAFDELTGTLQTYTHAEVVEDQPRYPHRGLLLDTARNFFSIPILKGIVDGLSYNKMNVLHWHITDTHSFPLHLDRIPELAWYGAYSRHKIYWPNDIKELVEYARVRGVKIVPEFDAPAHVGNGWQYVDEKQPEWDRLAVCVNQEPWQEFCVEPPCGQFNVVNPKLYEVLEDVYRDMFELFDSDIFHMGGDEVNFNCWNSSKEIKEYLHKHDLVGTEQDMLNLWGDFQRKALARLFDANGGKRLKVATWTNTLTEKAIEDYFQKDDYVIQIWTKMNDSQVSDIIKQGYKTIFSPYDRYYLDCGYSSWVGKGNNWCTPYKGWQDIYDTSPRKAYQQFEEMKDEYLKNILGGEVCMWSEQVEGIALEGKVWPRGAALGERLWTDPESDWSEANSRFFHQRQRMVQRGIAADTNQPEWCHQNEGSCFS